MSLKYRLRIFVFLLAIVPLLGAAYAIDGVIRENRIAKLDGSVAARLAAAQAAYENDRATAQSALSSLASSSAFVAALQGGKSAEIVPQTTLYTQPPLSLLVETRSSTDKVLTGKVADPPSFAQAADLKRGEQFLGRVTVSLPLDAERARRYAGDDTVLVGFLGDGALVTPNGRQASPFGALPARQGVDVRIAGVPYRAAGLTLTDTTTPVQLVALAPRAQIDRDASDLRRRLILVAALVLGLIVVLGELLVRAITGQLDVFAKRAREVGEGRLEGEIPVHGNDEFATVARSFNTMSRELEHRIAELEEERRRVAHAVARFGRALEATHDVQALLRIVVESAQEGLRARGARLMIVDERTGELVEHMRVGEAEQLRDELPEVVERGAGAEGLALQLLSPAMQDEPLPLVAAPLQSNRSVVGLITVVGPERGKFDQEDGETLLALARQGAIAIDNARMARQMTKQALTDGLTGLANHRAFQEQLRNEVERSQRFGLPLALVLLDLDEFKAVNDTRGHLAGDMVLRAVSTVLRGAIREIDLAARYGGEEFAVVLPGTSAEGAVRLAERLRVAIATRPMDGGDGSSISCTASFGVAEMPADARTQVDLIAAADRALYQAKQGGRNRVVAASRPGVSRG